MRAGPETGAWVHIWRLLWIALGIVSAVVVLLDSAVGWPPAFAGAAVLIVLVNFIGGVMDAAHWLGRHGMELLDRLRRRPPMEPPQNVYLQSDAGDRVPLEMVYKGWDPKERVHRWEAVPTGLLDGSKSWGMGADVLPGHSVITVTVGVVVEEP